MTDRGRKAGPDQQTLREKYAGDDVLLCASEPGSTRSAYITYGVLIGVVLAFQAFIFSRGLFNVFQIGIVVIFLITAVVYILRTARDAKDWLKLYERHYETASGLHEYAEIRDMNVGRDQLMLKTDRRTTFYAANAQQLGQVIQRQRSAGRKG